jgi:hypothetical protein
VITAVALGLFRLRAWANGRVAVEFVRDWLFPAVHDGQDLRIENENDSLRDWSPHCEGLTV